MIRILLVTISLIITFPAISRAAIPASPADIICGLERIVNPDSGSAEMVAMDGGQDYINEYGADSTATPCGMNICHAGSRTHTFHCCVGNGLEQTDLTLNGGELLFIPVSYEMPDMGQAAGSAFTEAELVISGAAKPGTPPPIAL
ncbi:MAG: hypothetical protein HY751_08240 [Nitrospinae bacterium]|nr:hypothetical protein [Nitrospinota bacterium]